MKKITALGRSITLTKTKALVLGFIVALLFGMAALVASAPAKADGPEVSLGHTVINSSVTTGEFAYRLPASQWEIGALAFGQGSTSRGDQGVHYGLSASYLVDPPSWPVYFRIGAAYIDEDNPLVGDTNYRLGVGREFYGGLFKVEFVHFSSAGLHKPNTGVDAIQLKLPLPNI